MAKHQLRLGFLFICFSSIYLLVTGDIRDCNFPHDFRSNRTVEDCTNTTKPSVVENCEILRKLSALVCAHLDDVEIPKNVQNNSKMCKEIADVGADIAFLASSNLVKDFFCQLFCIDSKSELNTWICVNILYGAKKLLELNPEKPEIETGAENGGRKTEKPITTKKTAEKTISAEKTKKKATDLMSKLMNLTTTAVDSSTEKKITISTPKSSTLTPKSSNLTTTAQVVDTEKPGTTNGGFGKETNEGNVAGTSAKAKTSEFNFGKNVESENLSSKNVGSETVGGSTAAIVEVTTISTGVPTTVDPTTVVPTTVVPTTGSTRAKVVVTEGGKATVGKETKVDENESVDVKQTDGDGNDEKLTSVEQDVDPDDVGQPDENYFNTPDDGEQLRPPIKTANTIDDNTLVGGSMPGPEFPQYADSHFFIYFLTAVVLCVLLYLAFHNKQKIIALIIEGRHERRRRSSSNVSYKKLDNNLDQVLHGTKASSVTPAHIIY